MSNHSKELDTLSSIIIGPNQVPILITPSIIIIYYFLQSFIFFFKVV